MNHAEDRANFESRLQSEINAANSRVEELRSEAQQEFQARQERHRKFLEKLELVRGVGKDRFDMLAKQFKFDVQRSDDTEGRGVRLSFHTELARVNLAFRLAHDLDVHNVLLTYDLEILPIFMKYQPHAQLEVPLDDFDKDTMLSWIDDRLIEFSRAYLSLQFNNEYQREHLVEDPVAKVRFPKQFAKSTLEHEGRTWYFITDDSCADFKRQHKIA